jgi:hypothetical protein
VISAKDKAKKNNDLASVDEKDLRAQNEPNFQSKYDSIQYLERCGRHWARWEAGELESQRQAKRKWVNFIIFHPIDALIFINSMEKLEKN